MIRLRNKTHLVEVRKIMFWFKSSVWVNTNKAQDVLEGLIKTPG